MRTTPLLRHGIRLLVLLVLLTGLTVQAQSDPRALEPNTGVRGSFDADNPAQVYTFVGSAGQSVTLTLNSLDDVPLSMLVTTARGDRVAGAAVASLVQFTLPADGTYYVTIFPASASGQPPSGSFTLQFAIEGGGGAASPGLGATYVQPSQYIIQGMEVSVTWDTTADVNLQVRDPLGQSLFWDSLATSSGGQFGQNINAFCQTPLVNGGSERATWGAGGVPTGSYEVMVFYREGCENQNPVTFTLNIRVDGETLEPIQGTLNPPATPDSDSVYIARFTLGTDGTVTVAQGGVYTLNALPASAADLQANARAITSGNTVTGTIVNDQLYQAYTFDARANNFVTITMTRLVGSLDTLLMLVNPDGTLLALNDDSNNSTDSQISAFRLPVDGTYTLVATRYGKELGGTEGEYSLTMSLSDIQTFTVPQVVTDLGFPAGSIEISLVWNTPADLQLLVRDPAGDSVFDDISTIASGGQLLASGNVGCRVSPTVQPVSYIAWPQGVVRAGTYEVAVWYQNPCNQNAPVSATLTIVVGGQVVFGDTINPLPDTTYLVSFAIGANNAVTLGQGGYVGDSRQLAYQGEVTSAPTIISGQPVTGEIGGGNVFDLYVFDGQAGDVVSIGMSALLQTGNLDCKLFLIGPGGLQAADNDDAVPGEVTDSLISNFTLPSDGQYIIIATRYGMNFGGTTGGYSLTFSKLN